MNHCSSLKSQAEWKRCSSRIALSLRISIGVALCDVEVDLEFEVDLGVAPRELWDINIL